ncbi:MAG TPA: tRNA lysidine(34) synthetase TilS [Acidimicrobiales bacterium]|nr:tRNA lysidine(34) synthetase TilS [Acidimicrobiales bacterium]
MTCAVSGGPDSMALLALATAAGCAATAIHVDHGLRPGSAAEADVVAGAAARLGAAFESRVAVVEAGSDLEARARAARYAVLPFDTLTGHTADDQAETVLLNLLRGAGLDGLRGMGVANRPLLALRRTETRALCAALDLTVVDDPSNRDPSIRRNRVRHELLPLLDAIAERDVVPVLTRQARLLGDEAVVLDELASALDPSDARLLAVAPAALARRAVRAWLRCETDAEHHPPDAATVERVLAVARGEAKGTDVGGGRRVTRSQGRLLLTVRSARA